MRIRLLIVWIAMVYGMGYVCAKHKKKHYGMKESNSSMEALKKIGLAGAEEEYNRTFQYGLSITLNISYAGARFIYVHFSAFHLPRGDSVTLRGLDGTSFILEEYGLAAVKDKDLGQNTSFYSERIPGDTVEIMYKSKKHNKKNILNSEYGFSIDKYVRGIPRLDSNGSLAVDTACALSQPNWKPASCYKNHTNFRESYKKSLALARMVTTGGTQYATGFLVGCDGYFLTNEHNVPSQSEVDTTDFGFHAQSDTCSDPCNERALGCNPSVVIRGGTLIHSSYSLDYALIQFDKHYISTLQSFNPLKLRKKLAEYGEDIYIPQHPDGLATVIAITSKDGSVTKIESQNVTNQCGVGQLGYSADTLGGSSGSPVLAFKDHRVIGIHHCGECNTNPSSRTAIPIHSIIADLKKNIHIPKCFFK